MKRIQKLLVFMCALVATIAIAIPAYAAGSHTLTITSETGGHTFTAYQIFSGDYDAASGALSNVEWGNGVSGDALLEALEKDTAIGRYFNSCYSAADVASVLQNAENGGVKVFQENSVAVDAFAAVVSGNLEGNGVTSTLEQGSSTYEYKISGLADGYYFVKDAIDDGSGTGNAYSKFIIQLANDEKVAAKADVPTITKKVTDINDTTGDTSPGDSADYDIGDDVPFTITATVADNLADYDVYKFVIHDTLSSGLKLDEESVVVKIDDGRIADGYYVNTSNLDPGCSFEVVFSDLTEVATVKASSKITVEYTATLTDAATIGGAGNDNTATLEYSNNPNESNGATTGKTVSDTVTVFTYQLIVNKVDDTTPDGRPLDGAAFKLEKKIKGSAGVEDSWEFVKEIEAATNQTRFVFKGLDDGTYKLTETTTPAGYNTMEPVEFTIAANHEESSADPQLIGLTGTATGVSLSFTPELDEGSLTTTVVNKRGATLPSTGGVGKTVLITAGAILAVGAGVGLVAKYRASRMK
ncbi:isopeptide-forming domain-containing fimbrial protein [Collinsella ihumii]|uniref:isopeptide-forming domain-containing fimbrial protein n=1 Tax=Collinsella ihumii TaxID=1720204 RepID=UPI0025AAF1D5|nr:isopeptide-forming domain-containing fimbrial protein [Collinsella ihumii]MDN0054714.1 isopeptide-forming domain-containing fimbrial protein [Collinsella ihumii]